MQRSGLGGFILVAIVFGFAAGYMAGARPMEVLPTAQAPDAPTGNNQPGAAGPAATAGKQPGGVQPSPRSAGDIRAYFSPGGGATDAIVRELDQARRTIDMQCYSFTSTAISRALVRAHERGVRVRLIVDANEMRDGHNEAKFLDRSGIEPFLDREHAIAHNKVMLIDGRVIITGSFNFTKAAERNNAENLLVIRDNASLYAAYEQNFARHLQHSEQLAPEPARR